MMIPRFSLATIAFPLLALLAVSNPAQARIELPEYDSALGYEFGDALIPEVLNPDEVCVDTANVPPPVPVSPRQFVLPEHTLFRNSLTELERWTDRLWFSFPRNHYSYPRPTGSWDDLFSDRIQTDVAFHLRRGMTTVEADQVMAGYWQEKTTNLVPGLIRFQSVSRQTDTYLLEHLRLVVRYQDGHLCGFGLRSLLRGSHMGFQF